MMFKSITNFACQRSNIISQAPLAFHILLAVQFCSCYTVVDLFLEIVLGVQRRTDIYQPLYMFFDLLSESLHIRIAAFVGMSSQCIARM